MELAFGDFRLDTSRRMLWEGQKFVTIGARAFSILEALVEAPGRLVSKSDLMDRAWPGISVDEANLRIQIANLRKSLGECGQYITTEQSLGYRFTGDVRRLADPNINPASQRFYAPSNPLKPIGREQSTASIREALTQHRLVTIVGPGGIGKTTLAVEIAGLVEAEFVDGVAFIDLALISDAGMVSTVVAAGLARRVMSEPLADIVGYLRTRRMLIVLDCCERVLDGVAELVDAILAAAPGVTMVATSREAIRLAGEYVVSLDGLNVPGDADVTATQAIDFGAVALFMRTASSHSRVFELNDQNVALVVGICRRMDGIPLAIDLVAGLVGTLDIKQIHDDLNERMSIMTFGRRGGLPRHRTIEATIAWSYETLTADESKVLRRLSVFDGSFTLAGAIDVAAYGNIDGPATENAVIALVQKSLLRVHFTNRAPTYSQLETTRHFASTRISTVEERRTAASNHARHILQRLRTIDWQGDRITNDRRQAVALALEVRQAISWAYIDQEDVLLPVLLTVAAERLWLELGLFMTHATRMKEARAWLDRCCTRDDQYPVLLASILSGIAYGVLYDTTDHDRINTIMEALRRSKDIDDRELYMRNLSHGYYFHALRHQGHLALNFAEQLREEAERLGRNDILAFATVAAGNARLQIGDWKLSREYLEGFLARGRIKLPCETIIYFGFNTPVLAYISLAILEGMQGQTSKCFEYLDIAIAITDDGRQAPMRFQALHFAACRMAFRVGDHERAQRYLDLLEHQARDFAPWQVMAKAYQAWMAYAKGNLVQARALLETDLANKPFASLTVSFYLLLAEVRLALGDLDGAEEAAQKGSSIKSGDQDPFVVGPSFRMRADILAARKEAKLTVEATEIYLLAIENARRHDAITLEIPPTIGLARAQISLGQSAKAFDLLTLLNDRITDGHTLPMVRELAGLLRDLAATEDNAESPRPSPSQETSEAINTGGIDRHLSLVSNQTSR